MLHSYCCYLYTIAVSPATSKHGQYAISNECHLKQSLFSALVIPRGNTTVFSYHQPRICCRSISPALEGALSAEQIPDQRRHCKAPTGEPTESLASPLLSVLGIHLSEHTGCEVTRSTKRSHWDCPNHTSTQQATNQSPSGHINTAVNISAAEDFRIKSHLFLSCYRLQHRKIADIFSNLRSIQLAFGLAHYYLKGRRELSLPITGCEAP